MKHITEQQQKQRNRKDGRLCSTKKMVIMAIMILLLALPLVAETVDGQQEEVTDQQLLNFGIALVEVQEIQIEANEGIYSIIENSELPLERLDEIFIVQQQAPQNLPEVATEEELVQYNTVMGSIMKIQLETESKVIDSLAQYSYDFESFSQMATKIQGDPILLQRFQTLFSSQEEGI